MSKFNGLNKPVDGSLAPITVLSIVPSSRSILLISTDPVPLPDKIKSAFDVVTLTTLSVKFIDESMVKFDTFTTPVPPGVSFRSAFELVEIMLSLKVRLSTVTGAANDVAPETAMLAIVVAPSTVMFPDVVKLSFPKLMAPVESVIDPLPAVSVLFIDMLEADVVRFSLPKLIVPDESVIEPFASVRLPIVEPVAAVIVPEVVKFSLPKLIAPLESVIDPSASVKLPNVEPVRKFFVVAKSNPPATDVLPSTIKFSLTFMIEESKA